MYFQDKKFFFCSIKEKEPCVIISVVIVTFDNINADNNCVIKSIGKPISR